MKGKYTYRVVDETDTVLLRGDCVLRYGSPVVGGSGWSVERWRSPYAVVAFNGSPSPIGVLKFSTNRSGHFLSDGTWVSRGHRRQGIAKEMWRWALRYSNAEYVDIKLVSDLGFTLCKALERNHKKIDFDVCEDGGRKLRDIRQ